MVIKHSKISTIADGSDTNLVRPSDWNAPHNLEDATIKDSHLDLGTGTGQISQETIPDGPNYKRIQVGLEASKPAPGTADRFYLAKDTKKLYRDTGITWEIVTSLAEADLSLNFTTHSNTNDPNTDEKAALAGTNGTPSGTNKYVTNSDPRNADARTPTGAAGGDLSGTYPNPSVAGGAITDAKVAAANKDGLAATPSMRTLGTGAQQACAGNDSRLSDNRTPTAHKDTHKTGGSDALTLTDLLDCVARVTVRKNTGASDVGSRRRLNLIEGANITLTVADDPTNEEVDVTIAASGGGGGDSGEGHVTILSPSYSSVVAGTWAMSGPGTDTAVFSGYLYNTSGADGDQVDYKAYLAAGTYNIVQLGHIYSSRGKWEVLIDGVLAGIFDEYGASSAVGRNVITGVTVSTSGIKTISCKVNGKNASSSGYTIVIVALIFYRTA